MSSIKFIPNGSVTSVSGFKAGGITAGLKVSGRSDMAMIFSETDASFAGAYTACTFAAAPVKICQERSRNSKSIRAVVVNSGNANACTGDQGLENAREMCLFCAEQLGIKADEVMVSSTGRIGVQLPMQKIKAGISKAVQALSASGGMAAAEAIMTTDTMPKTTALEFSVNGKTVRIGGMTKGAGMIAPELKTVPHATMLAYITTDAKIENSLLNSMLAQAVEMSFNRIDIDGDMSTNDTVIIMANGSSGAEIKESTPEAELFSKALIQLTQNLAHAMVMDGEGVTKLVTLNVKGAKDDDDASKCAKAVANSLLCKTAWFGGDPNWGRVIAAAGYSKAEFKPEDVKLYYDELPVVINAKDAGTSESELAKVLAKREFSITVDLGAGNGEYWMWTSDISYEYVKINAEYHT